MTRRNRDRLHRSIGASLIFVFLGTLMSLLSYFMLANLDAIAAFTGDSRTMLGQLGIIAGISAFLAFMAVPMIIFEGTRR